MKRLYRSTTDKMVAGVFGGLAEYFHIDATIFRLIYAVLCVFSHFTLVLVYIIAAIIIPKDYDVL